MDDELKKFIGKRKVAYLGSIDDDGYPNIKTMLYPRRVNDFREFYFSTNTSSLRVKQFSNNPKACIYFNDTLVFKGVMLRGNVEVIDDQDMKNELWERGDTKYYPLGVTDPDYCVLKFTVDEEYVPRAYRI